MKYASISMNSSSARERERDSHQGRPHQTRPEFGNIQEYACEEKYEKVQLILLPKFQSLLNNEFDWLLEGTVYKHLPKLMHNFFLILFSC